MPTIAPTISLLLQGFLLGWSVAWPPGPINAEIIRRTLARGFWPGYSLCLGACVGDAGWAVVVVIGVGSFFAGPVAQTILAVLSTALLIALAVVFLRGAATAIARWRAGTPPPEPTPLDGARAGFALGLTMALTGPWNVAFWLAVIGRAETATLGVESSLVIAAGVIAGAATWGIVLGSAVSLARRRFDVTLWDIVAKGATGVLMLTFAAKSLLHLLA